MNSLKRKISKFFTGIKKIPQGKHHIDFITALLSIPVLLSVIILNYSNLQNSKKATTESNPTPVEKVIVVPQNESSPTPQSSTPGVCKKDIGPIDITYPKEGQTVSDNPLCITIKYDDSNYCSVVWAYRINNGIWSDFTSNNPCIYNPPDGNIKFDLRIQSTVSQKQEDISRNFTYSKSSNPSASSSAQ